MLNDVRTPLSNRKESVYTRDARNMVPQRSLETCRGVGEEDPSQRLMSSRIWLIAAEISQESAALLATKLRGDISQQILILIVIVMRTPDSTDLIKE
jgi:hypothetical protein